MSLVRWLARKLIGLVMKLVKLVLALAVVSGLLLILDVLLLRGTERAEED